MIYLFAGLAALGLLAAAIWFLTNANSAALARGLRFLAYGILAAAGIVLFLRTMPLIEALVLSVAWPIVITYFARTLRRRIGARPFARRAPSSGQSSAIETDWLSLALDHDSGEMTGMVKRGKHAGATLVGLDDAAVRSLYRELVTHDLGSARLLETYVERMRPSLDLHAGGGEDKAASSSMMSRSEALAVLGLAEGATGEEIKAAYQRLMKQVHPDHGGSDYLAAKLNEARGMLLSE